ncbi:ARPC2 [Lepeophtheirus salmonis]|uniref:Arp2/3 complex 34 kDa subunit n=1 Tax=Lepeophtheirus salmonis TaxID=72036 RepID=A0A7R8CTW1_LEPSM|nr:ARPC2 [Lepeophtheirus salmonis]CAF2877327.1 ARPC2 [Lepeophtheirus salmonis]
MYRWVAMKDEFAECLSENHTLIQAVLVFPNVVRRPPLAAALKRGPHTLETGLPIGIMILLEVHNRIVEDTLGVKIRNALDGIAPSSVSVKNADFDGVLYKINNQPGDKTKINTSVALRFFDINESGSHLEEVYGKENLLHPPREEGYDVTVVFYINASIVRYRDDETMWIEAKSDRVTVVFSTVLKDDDDIVIGKILFSWDPPASLNDTDARVGEGVGYITFVLFPRHTQPSNRDNTINLIHLFRNYLHYHIKCSKAYIHSRMRAKTADFLKVLNRAKPEAPNKKSTTNIPCA